MRSCRLPGDPSISLPFDSRMPLHVEVSASAAATLDLTLSDRSSNTLLYLFSCMASLFNIEETCRMCVIALNVQTRTVHVRLQKRMNVT